MEPEIRQIQKMLREISFFDNRIERIVPDGIYGGQTESSVRSFQRSNNLRETGVVDNDTWDKITEVYEDIVRKNREAVGLELAEDTALPIRVGSEARSLYVIQAMLLALSEVFDNLGGVEVTGIYDYSTQSAVRDIRILNGLEPDADIDREFVNRLVKLYTTHIIRNTVSDSREISG